MGDALENMKRSRRPKLDVARETSLVGVTQVQPKEPEAPPIQLERGKRRNVHMLKDKDLRSQMLVMEHSITLETLFEGLLEVVDQHPDMLNQAIEHAKHNRALRVEAGQRAKLETMNKNAKL